MKELILDIPQLLEVIHHQEQHADEEDNGGNKSQRPTTASTMMVETLMNRKQECYDLFNLFDNSVKSIETLLLFDATEAATTITIEFTEAMIQKVDVWFETTFQDILIEKVW